MMSNIERYAQLKGISRQDSLQVFLQVIVLKNLNLKAARLIGGTSLVLGYGSPRFSEDIDLTGIENPLVLKPHLKRAEKEIAGLLSARRVDLKGPKENRNTWKLRCEVDTTLRATLHVDTQPYAALTHHPFIIEYPGVAPFIFAGEALEEIMADKLVAIAARSYLGGRDIFDVWYHWLRSERTPDETNVVFEYVRQKLVVRKLDRAEFLERISARIGADITKRVEEEWERYLPKNFKGPELFDQIFLTTQKFLSGLKI